MVCLLRAVAFGVLKQWDFQHRGSALDLLGVDGVVGVGCAYVGLLGAGHRDVCRFLDLQPQVLARLGGLDVLRDFDVVKVHGIGSGAGCVLIHPHGVHAGVPCIGGAIYPEGLSAGLAGQHPPAQGVTAQDVQGVAAQLLGQLPIGRPDQGTVGAVAVQLPRLEHSVNGGLGRPPEDHQNPHGIVASLQPHAHNHMDAGYFPPHHLGPHHEECEERNLAGFFHGSGLLVYALVKFRLTGAAHDITQHALCLLFSCGHFLVQAVHRLGAFRS